MKSTDFILTTCLDDAFDAESNKTHVQLSPLIKTASVKFEVTAYSDKLFDSLEIKRPENMKRWAVKRKAEFLAGRYAAKLAIKALGHHQFQVAIGESREPVFGQELIGSITHTQAVAMAIVAHHSAFDGIGIDRETLIDQSTFDQIVATVFSEKEYALLSGADRLKAATIGYSAKESFFKAAFASVGHYFDFHAVEIKKIDWQKKEVELVIKENLGTQFAAEKSVVAKFIIEGCDVVSRVIV